MNTLCDSLEIGNCGSLCLHVLVLFTLCLYLPSVYMSVCLYSPCLYGHPLSTCLCLCVYIHPLSTCVCVYIHPCLHVNVSMFQHQARPEKGEQDREQVQEDRRHEAVRHRLQRKLEIHGPEQIRLGRGGGRKATFALTFT